MIRCENCGHKLNAGQKVCDVCGRPVPARNTEDAELEEQLAKSIAQIVENETSDAQVYLKEIQGTLDKSDSSRKQAETGKRDVLGVSQRSVASQAGSARKNIDYSSEQPLRRQSTQTRSSAQMRNSAQTRQNTASNQNTRTRQNTASDNRRYSEEQERMSAKKKNKKNNGGKIAVIVISVIVAVVAIVALAFFTINMVLKKAQNNFAYYNNTGIEYVQNGKYAEAVPYLEKALTFSESDGKVNLRFSLYDCYVATDNTEKAVSMLYNILGVDEYNLEAIVYLENYYENAGVTDALVELYNKYKDTAAAAAVQKYYVEAPKISLEGGKYTSTLDIQITSDYDFDIYYTTDGSEPTTGSTLYTGSIEIGDGNTTLKCIAVNGYNIVSEVVTAEYEVEYKQPDEPTISPRSGSYETEQLIVIGNIPAGGKAYYTLDNTTPTDKSTEYKGPFDMPVGNNVLSVVTYDKKGLKSQVVKRNYVLTLTDKVSQERALEILWQAMEYKNMVDSQHRSSDGEPVSLVLDEKKTIDGHSIWVFNIIVSTEQGDMKANYQMGVDSNDSYVYTVYENNGVYTLDEVVY